jgi:hypothetical protein
MEMILNSEQISPARSKGTEKYTSEGREKCREGARK